MTKNIEELCTCIDCGKNHLKFEEIVWMEDDKEGEIDESTVRCMKCHFRFISPLLASKLPKKASEVAEKGFKKLTKEFENEYNRRTLKRAIQNI